MRTILLIMLGISWLHAGNTVRDSATGLIWQDTKANKARKSWSAAKSFCQNSNIGE